MTVWIHKFAAATPVVKHPGHGDQAVHTPKKGPVADRAQAKADGGGGGGGGIPKGSDLDLRPNAEGTEVKVSGTVRGKGRKGVVVFSDSRGSFHEVEFSDGKTASYHGSDLTAI